MEPMTAPLRRINRAKEHLDCLDREIEAFKGRQPYKCSLHRGSQKGECILRPYLTENLPYSWGISIGDCAHSLRSALDNIAWALAIKPDKKVEFPIFIKEDNDFASKLKLLRKDVRDHVKAVQPFNGSGGKGVAHPLWILHVINNLDKHRVILPGTTRIQVAIGLEKPRWFFIDGFSRFKEGAIEIKMFHPKPSEYDFERTVRAQIKFDISDPLDKHGSPPRLTLGDLRVIYNFVRNDVYPRFAHLLKTEEPSV